ncbi:hypothetical protein RRG08_016468 [Elysia crispata]|uniref:Uncharacterized protein n=1 Tax=Elysia crispata TaxID=231223 RepID=A0AAE1CV72_9GAST|nr:hypothetical protein RRG08_016468 [Elysia crispata]
MKSSSRLESLGQYRLESRSEEIRLEYSTGPQTRLLSEPGWQVCKRFSVRQPWTWVALYFFVEENFWSPELLHKCGLVISQHKMTSGRIAARVFHQPKCSHCLDVREAILPAVSSCRKGAPIRIS